MNQNLDGGSNEWHKTARVATRCILHLDAHTQLRFSSAEVIMSPPTVYDKIRSLKESNLGVPVVVTLNQSSNGEVSYGIRTFDDIFEKERGVADRFKKMELAPIPESHKAQGQKGRISQVCKLISVLCFDPNGNNDPEVKHSEPCLHGGGFHYRKVKLVVEDDDDTEAMTIRVQDVFDIEKKVRNVFITNELGDERFFAVNPTQHFGDPDIPGKLDYNEEFLYEYIQDGWTMRTDYVHFNDSDFADGFSYFPNEKSVQSMNRKILNSLPKLLLQDLKPEADEAEAEKAAAEKAAAEKAEAEKAEGEKAEAEKAAAEPDLTKFEESINKNPEKQAIWMRDKIEDVMNNFCFKISDSNFVLSEEIVETKHGEEYRIEIIFDQFRIVGIPDKDKAYKAIDFTEDFKRVLACWKKWNEAKDEEAKRKLNRMFAYWCKKITVQSRGRFTFPDIVSSTSKLWDNVPSAKMRITIGDKDYTVPKKVFTNEGQLIARFPDLSNEGMKTKVEFLSLINSIEQKYGNIVSIIGYVRRGGKEEGRTLFIAKCVKNGASGAEFVGILNTTCSLLVPDFIYLDLEESKAVHFIGNGFDAVKDSEYLHIKKHVELSVNVGDDKEFIKLNEESAKKIKMLSHVTRNDHLHPQKGKRPAPAPYFDEETMDEGNTIAEHPTKRTKPLTNNYPVAT